MTRKELKCLFLIAVTFIAACIETDIYLPAFPDMMLYFGVSEEAIQRLLTWNFVGICLAGPFYGPISDSFGRKKPLLAALGLFLVGSILTSTAESFQTMLAGRFLQGIGSGGCFTLGTAIIYDTFQAEKAFRATNQLNSTIPFVMAAAPLVGGYLNQVYGFRSNFLAIALLVFLSLVVSLFFFDEPLPIANRRPFTLRKILADYKRVCSCTAFWQLTTAMCLMFAGYIVFLSATSVLFMVEFGVSKQAFPWFQATLLAGWLIGSLTCHRALTIWGARTIKTVGVTLLVTGGLGFALLGTAFPTNPYLMTAMMVAYSFGANWTQGLYFPEGMALLPDIKGITASLITSMRLLLTAVVVAVASSFYDGTIYPIIAILISILLVFLPCILFYERNTRAGARQIVETS